jgi:retron-type reverse transcriptase
MKRETNLIEKIADPDNLRLAYWKAQRGKSCKQDVLLFQKQLDANLLSLITQIQQASVIVGNYTYFTVFDPKQRLICAAAFPERVLHHAIMNICTANFEKYQLFDSYASRLGKGSYAALQRAMYYQRKYKWFLKLDVRKYFDSIDHQILIELLSSRFKETKLHNIFYDIIDSYHVETNKGLPIGNLTSQYFANHYLAVSDHYIKEQLKIEGFVRYMDDMVLWDNDKDALNNKGKQLQSFIKTFLKLELKPFCLNSTQKGLPFLGYTIYSNMLRLNRRSKKRFIIKLNKYEENLKNNYWNQTEFQKHVLPLLAFTKHADSFCFRKKCMEKIYGQ